ncbi:MAG: amino-acid N-acetyltransferase [Opitutales bacterium]|nr:amino-acid N-acetyltransferase [Opitutales bacterium]MCH8539913.1 amino-acid N-acetyltransferase [Opitutales bacterium]
MASSDAPSLPNPKELRGILKYVPLFQDRIFVIALDGRIVSDENLSNLLLDIAVLQSLSIRVVLVFGISDQLATEAKDQGISPSDLRGFGPTDAQTLSCAQKAASTLSQFLMGKLTQVGLKAVLTNAVMPVPMGIVKGVDQLHTGKVGRVDRALLQNLLSQKVIPLLSPLAFDRDGMGWRLNSDHLATEVALALEAGKILFLQPEAGLYHNEAFYRQISVEELNNKLETAPEGFSGGALSKARHAVRAVLNNIPRAHLVDGTLHEGLLAEIFSSEGVGTLIYGNEYQQVRPATRRDIRTLYQFTRQAVKREQLVHRTLAHIEKSFNQYYLFEIDETPVACAALEIYPGGESAELLSLYVQPTHQHLGIGRKLVEFICQEARQKGARRIFALSTQSFSFFRNACSFSENPSTELPAARLDSLRESGRNSRVMVRELNT